MSHRQGLVAELDLGALRVETVGGQPEAITLRWTGIGRPGRVRPVESPVGEAELTANRATYHRPDDSEEWYLNGPLGVEQGFVLREPPETEGGELVLELTTAGDLAPRLVDGAHAVSLVASDGTPVLRYTDAIVLDAAGRSLAVRLEVEDTSVRLLIDDREASYPLAIDPLIWAEAKKIVSPEPRARFGHAVALSGDIALVGAPDQRVTGDDFNAYCSYGFPDCISAGYPMAQCDFNTWQCYYDLVGAVHVLYKNQGGAENWGTAAVIQPSFDTLQSIPMYRLGASLALSGDTAIIGRPDNGAGVVQIHYRDNWGANQWGPAWEGSPGGLAAGDAYGYAVAVDGDTAVVGVPFHDAGATDAGAAFVSGRDQGGADYWGEVKKLVASAPGASDTFGSAVAVSGAVALVGAPGHDLAGANAGAAFLFAQDAGGVANWGQIKVLTASDADPGDAFGSSLALSGDDAVVGAHLDDGEGTDAGAAYLFSRNQGGADNWGLVKKLTASDGASGDHFGRSVSIAGDWIVVGAEGEDEGVSNAGAAYTFARDEGGVGNWGEINVVRARDRTANAYYGWSVAVGAGAAIVGAYGDATNAGAAYALRLRSDDGDACTADGECASRHCVELLCCDTACSGTCEACDQARTGGADGTCLPIPYGSDPDGECAAGEELCDGQGHCKLVGGRPCSLGADCLNGLCVDGFCCDAACNGSCEACSSAKTGGVDGVCALVPAGSDPDNECGAGRSCDGAASCRKEVGQPCALGAECLSGHCADGFCCNGPCTATCVACSAQKNGVADGACAPIPANQDPDAECVAGQQLCDGAGLCKTLLGLDCGVPSQCLSGFCADGHCCDEACDEPCDGCAIAGSEGTCSVVPDGGVGDGSCGGYLCAGATTTCPSTCSSSADCDSTHYCIENACEAKLGDGTGCSEPSVCQSGFCVDGVCCNSACGGVCQACSASAKGDGDDGVCGPVAAGSDPDDECTLAVDYPASCGADGTCDGTGRCRQHALADVVCAPASCVEGVATFAAECDGAGQCAEPQTEDCAPYVCDVDSRCKTECASNSDCASGYTCDPPTCTSGATCDADGHTISRPDGSSHDCAPFRCNAAAICQSPCSSTADCISGFSCSASGECVPDPGVGPTADDDGCGCRLAGSTRRGSWVSAMAFLCVGTLVRRRRAGFRWPNERG